MSSEVLLCTGGYDHTIRLWNVVQGSCTAVLQHNESHINALCIAPDRSLLAAAGNPCVRLYDPHHSPLTATGGSSSTSVTASTALHTLNIKSGSSGGEAEEERVNVLDVAFHDPQVLMAAGEDGTVRLWDLRVGGKSVSSTMLPGGNKLTCVYLQTEEMRIWYGDAKGRIACWDMSANKLIYERDVSSGEVSAVTCHAGVILCGDYAGRVYHLEDDMARCIHTHSGHVTYVGSSPDGRYFVSTSADHTAQLYNKHPDLSLGCTSLEKGRSLEGHSKWVWDATFSADSMYVLTASTDTTVRLWEVQSGEQVSVFTGQHTKGITSVALNDLY